MCVVTRAMEIMYEVDRAIVFLRLVDRAIAYVGWRGLYILCWMDMHGYSLFVLGG
jgi:hypothetical protein